LKHFEEARQLFDQNSTPLERKHLKEEHKKWNLAPVKGPDVYEWSVCFLYRKLLHKVAQLICLKLAKNSSRKCLDYRLIRVLDNKSDFNHNNK
jgi:hypothetical protein